MGNVDHFGCHLYLAVTFQPFLIVTMTISPFSSSQQLPREYHTRIRGGTKDNDNRDQQCVWSWLQYPFQNITAQVICQTMSTSSFTLTADSVSQALKIGDNNVIESKGVTFKSVLSFTVHRCTSLWDWRCLPLSSRCWQECDSHQRLHYRRVLSGEHLWGHTREYGHLWIWVYEAGSDRETSGTRQHSSLNRRSFPCSDFLELRVIALYAVMLIPNSLQGNNTDL